MKSALWLPIAALVLGACASTGPDQQTLYARVGGMQPIGAVAGYFSDAVVADNRLRPSVRTDASVMRLEVEQHLCSVARGPCKSIGRNLEFYFEERGIEDDGFALVMQHLDTAMRKAGVSDQQAAELRRLVLSECGNKKRKGC